MLKLERNVSLAQHTTFRIGGTVSYFIQPESVEEVAQAIRFAREHDLRIHVISNGSDTIFPDYHMHALVIRMDKLEGIRFVSEDTVEVLAGESLPKLAIEMEARGLSGFEYLFGIPGKVGGAVAKNAGAYGLEIKDILLSVKLVSWNGELMEVEAKHLNLRYRESDVLRYGIVVSATFKLRKDDINEIEERRKTFSRRRMQTQPYGVHTAGCMFKNPKGHSAGKLLESVGMKGERKGDIVISTKHANFFINVGNGRSEDVLYLMELAKRRVYETYGILLEEEVVVVR